MLSECINAVGRSGCAVAMYTYIRILSGQENTCIIVYMYRNGCSQHLRESREDRSSSVIDVRVASCRVWPNTVAAHLHC